MNENYLNLENAVGVVLNGIRRAKKIVVKLGSSLVTDDGRGLNHKVLISWSAQISAIQKEGCSVLLVSSGAIAEGVRRIGLTSRPKDLPALQATAAIGQLSLCSAYQDCFQKNGLSCAQILLTHEDLADRERYLNARATILTLLSYKVIPVINENDTVSTNEIKLGDNDTLAALVANLVEAEMLIILTDQNGLYTQDPKKYPQADVLPFAYASDSRLDAMVGKSVSSVGVGGMYTKITAARRAARGGTHTVIASGKTDNVLQKIFYGESVGTLLLASMSPIPARKKWIGDHLQLKGKLTVDDGARKALQHCGKSLLPVGVVYVSGEFNRGEAVLICDQNDQEIARGLVNYSSVDTKKILGCASSDVESILGFVSELELVHRDNLVLSVL